MSIVWSRGSDLGLTSWLNRYRDLVNTFYKFEVIGSSVVCSIRLFLFLNLFTKQTLSVLLIGNAQKADKSQDSLLTTSIDRKRFVQEY